jgi:hypothetical protein
MPTAPFNKMQFVTATINHRRRRGGSERQFLFAEPLGTAFIRPQERDAMSAISVPLSRGDTRALLASSYA